MARLLPLDDFRSRRAVLTRGDFLIARRPAERANDRIDKATWDSVVTLPDDVAVRTTNYHGTAIRELHDLWGAWIECYGENSDCLFPVMLDAADDFQAATYAALTGYYRLSISAVRSALELVAIGTWAHVCGKRQEFNDWRAGKRTLSLGQACDGLITGARTLENDLHQLVGDSLFAQKTPKAEGGFVRRIFDGISNFTHARPGSTDGDMRKSNGPIYVRSAFKHVTWIEFEAFALSYVLALLARPNLPTTNSQHDVPMAFCFTADTTNNCLITAPEMAELFGLGCSAIAVVRFDPKMPDKFSMFTSDVSSECLQSALSKKAEGFVHDALSRLAPANN